ncbi:MAG TPA: HAD-IIA family hydrolase [Roseiflexaceae bacterium]|nr:HAD-IIA family hydrolase [Roseiflexaceae bacterium]
MFDLNHYNAALLDMDGVLYRGQMPLPGVNEMLAMFTRRGITYACVTNNSTLTPEQYESKLAAMGIAIPAARVITSSVATRRYLETQALRGTTAFYIGMEGLREALFGDGYFIYDEQRPQIVVSGLDMGATYTKLKIAALAIRAGARFVGTNPDLTLPTEEGLVPGAGSIQALLTAATGVTPLVIGKPEPTMLHAAIDILQADPQRTLVIGDRLDTDIAGAAAAGLASALVLTGVTTPADLEHSALQPEAVYAGLPELVTGWN